MYISEKKVAFWLSIAVIIIAPFENIVGIEIIIYPLAIIILTLCVLEKHTVKLQESICLLLYLLYAMITCFWSRNVYALSSMLTTTVMFIFLFLQLQFSYTQEEAKSLEVAIILQGIILLGMCFIYGKYQDSRFWIISESTGADPNYLSGWFILPTCICIKCLFRERWPIFIRGILLTEVVLALYFIMQSGSRSGLICNFGAIILCVCYELRSTIKKKPAIGLVAVLLSLYLLYTTLQMMPETMLYRLAVSDSNLGGRGEIWKELCTVLMSNMPGFLFGMGQGSVTYYTSYQIVAHNTFLDVLFETGLIGLLLYCWFCASAFRRAVSKSWIISIALFSNYVLIFTLSSIYMRPLIFMLFYADYQIEESD